MAFVVFVLNVGVLAKNGLHIITTQIIFFFIVAASLELIEKSETKFEFFINFAHNTKRNHDFKLEN